MRIHQPLTEGYQRPNLLNDNDDLILKTADLEITRNSEAASPMTAPTARSRQMDVLTGT